ncbi:hybrid sensor histidine kinase/response regulator transcription factor [Niabella aquatica]
MKDKMAGRTLGYYVVIFYLLFSTRNNACAQVSFVNYTDANGLSSNSVTCIFQDHEGMLWIGTQNGLNRFDGYSFKRFNSRQESGRAITNDVVTAMLSDKNGRLVIGTPKGLNLYDPLSRSFLKIDGNPLLEAFKNSSITALFAKGNSLWVGSKEKGLSRYDQQKQLLLNEIANFPKNTVITCLFEDKENKLYIGTNNGLYVYMFNPKGRLIREIRHFQNDYINVIYKDSNTTLWVGTKQGLIRIAAVSQSNAGTLDISSSRFTFHPSSPSGISHNDIRSITEDKKSNLWIGTRGGGLNRLSVNSSPRNTLFKHFLHTPNNPNSLIQNEVFATYVDTSGTLWAGTYNGISKIVPSFDNFHHFQNSPFSTQSISNNNVAAILPYVINGKQFVYIGGSGGINTAATIAVHNQEYRFYAIPDNNSDIEKRKVQSLFMYRPGILWIGTKKGIRIYDYHNSRFLPPPLTLNQLPEVTIRKIHRDKTGLIWIGTTNGLYVWDPQKSLLSPSLLSSQKKPNTNYRDYIEPNQYENVFAIEEDLSGNIWVGTWGGGLVKFKAGNIKEQPLMYTNDPSNPKSLSSNYVASLYCSKKGEIWVGTSNGLNLLSSADNAAAFAMYASTYNTEYDTHIAGIQEDDKGHLWLATLNSICRFDPKNTRFLNYQFPFGNITKENYTMGVAKDQEGYMYFGGMSGFISFHPDSIITSYRHFPLVLSECQVSSGNLQKSDPEINWPQKKVYLTYKDLGFSFSLTSTDYSISQQVSYAYKLEGIDQDWIYRPPDQRHASYANLKPGTYILKAKATNALGIWSSPETLLTIIVETPFWKTWWAYAIYIVLLLLVLHRLIQYVLERERLKDRLKMEQIEKEKIKELEELKLNYFTNISHEFRTPLTLILGPLEQLYSTISPMADGPTKENLSFIRNNVDHLFRLINQLMDFRKAEGNNMKLSVSEGEIISFITTIKDSFTNLAQRKQIKIYFITDLDFLTVWIDWDKLEKILNNLLYNAISFTPPLGEVKLKSAYNEGQLAISVQDTGHGIPPDQIDHIFKPFFQADNQVVSGAYGYGIGLSLVEKLILLHHGQISVESTPNKGTTFHFTFPATKASYQPAEIQPNTQYKSFTVNEILSEPEYLAEQEYNSDSSAGGYKLLIIDDNPDIRRYLSNCFSTIYQIEEAANGFEGINKAVSFNPDLIITDVLMPEMDGNEFCEKIKVNIATSHIPIIMLTALDQKEQQIKGLETGADIYMVKPIYYDVLKAQVKRLIENREILKKHFQQQIVIQPKEVTATSIDSTFLAQAIEVVENNIGNCEFTVDQFARALTMGRSVLYRKLKSLTGLSPNDFIKTLRLKKAAQLLSKNAGNVSDVCYNVGFTDPGYFTKCFKKEFGQTPKDYTLNDTVI